MTNLLEVEGVSYKVSVEIKRSVLQRAFEEALARKVGFEVPLRIDYQEETMDISVFVSDAFLNALNDDAHDALLTHFDADDPYQETYFLLFDVLGIKNDDFRNHVYVYANLHNKDNDRFSVIIESDCDFYKEHIEPNIAIV